MSDIPRRARIDQHTPAEAAIRAAVLAVEEAGAHPLLTDAVILLGKAQDKVADFVDGNFDGANRGRWWGPKFCPHPGKECIDGCYFCGRKVYNASGYHDHTKVSKRDEPDTYSCVCESC